MSPYSACVRITNYWVEAQPAVSGINGGAVVCVNSAEDSKLTFYEQDELLCIANGGTRKWYKAAYSFSHPYEDMLDDYNEFLTAVEQSEFLTFVEKVEMPEEIITGGNHYIPLIHLGDGTDETEFAVKSDATLKMVVITRLELDGSPSVTDGYSVGIDYIKAGEPLRIAVNIPEKVPGLVIRGFDELGEEHVYYVSRDMSADGDKLTLTPADGGI